MSEAPLVTPADINDNDKLMAALCYFLTPIVPIIVLVVETMKVRPYQKYHALQGLGAFVGLMLFEVLACVLYFACTVLTAGILAICLWVIFFLPYIPLLYYTYLAYAKPSYFEIPVITKFMRQQGWLQV
jgi:uncharacterized membrane protein